MKKPGPKAIDGKRERFRAAPVVSRHTKVKLEAWREFYGVPVGRSIDCLLEHAEKSPETFRIHK